MASPYLTSLGVSLIDQQRLPSQAAFPRHFNPYASALWSLVVQALEFKLPQQAWKEAIEKFLALCEEKNVYPFRSQGSGNQELLAHLKKCRDAVIQVLEEVHAPLMSQYSVLRIKRAALLNDKGFTLTVTSTFILNDPTFKQYLVNKGFTATSGGRWKRRVDQFTWVVFWFRANRWNVSYVITGPHIPQVLDKMPAKQKMEKFIVEDMWRPITKQARPLYVGPRFI